MVRKKKEIRIVFGKGNFICYVCNQQYTVAEKSKIIVLDENEDFQNVCKLCEKKLNPDEFEHVKDAIMGSYFIKRDKKKKLLYKIKKLIGKEI